MKYQSIIKRDIRLLAASAGANALRMRSAYLIFTAVTIVIAIALWISTPEPASATRHVRLDLGNPGISSAVEMSVHGADFDPLALASPAAPR